MRGAGRDRPRLRDHRALVGATVGLVVLETVVVAAIAPEHSVALAPQVSAPAPFDVFHDLRWLLVYHESWLGLALELAVLLAWRTAVANLVVRFAWPTDGVLPSWRAQARRVLPFVAIEVVVLTPFAVLLFAMAVLSLSWLFFVAVPVLVMVACLVHHGAVGDRWWRDAPAKAGVVAVLIAFVNLTVAGAVLAVASWWLLVPVAVMAGVVNAWCWLRIVHALADRVVAPRRRPFALVGIAGVLVLVVVGTAVGFAVSVAVEGARRPLARARADATGPPVLVVKGFNSKWEGITRRWVDGNYRIRRFSYRGLDAHRKPLPYERSDTHRSVRDLAREMRRQVDAFHRAAGAPVSIVAESEGSLVAQAYVAATPNAPVRTLVLLSPLLAPGRVYYPPAGNTGWGLAAGVVLDGLAAAVGAVGPVDVSADVPLFRSVVDEAPPLRALIHCPAPGLREAAVLPLDSGVSAPAPVDVDLPYAVVPAFHGGLLGDATTARVVGRALRHRPLSSSDFWEGVGEVVSAGAAAWQVPDLERSVNSEWSSLPAGDCRAVRAELRRWLASG